MHHLLDGAVEHTLEMGGVIIEGYPVDPEGGRIDTISGYVGTIGLFEAHGFERVEQTKGQRGGKLRWLVRRKLT
jgi:hypothetical protein